MKVNANRNYGIDLLRIFSMLFVVILHCLGHGGILQNVIANSQQYKIAWILEIICYCAVDVFALISGYVSYTKEEKEIKYSRYINLWLQVFFYGIVICIITFFINSSLLNEKVILGSLFPVMYNSYWYFTAYTCLFLFMPIINKGIRSSDDKYLKRLFIAIILIFTIVELLYPKFILSGGYSFVWIMILYIIGAIIKKTNLLSNVKSYILIIGIIILYLITYLYKLYGFEGQILNFIIGKDILISYISPTILLISIFYLVLFSRINLKKGINKVIGFMAPSSFAVYIINENSIIRDNIISGLFKDLANGAVKSILINVFLFSFLFLICSILIDKFRIILFKVLKIEK